MNKSRRRKIMSVSHILSSMWVIYCHQCESYTFNCESYTIINMSHILSSIVSHILSSIVSNILSSMWVIYYHQCESYTIIKVSHILSPMWVIYYHQCESYTITNVSHILSSMPHRDGSKRAESAFPFQRTGSILYMLPSIHNHSGHCRCRGT